VSAERPLVALGGPPGSGKTTAARLLAPRLGLEYTSVGELFRAEATRHGMDLAAFSRYAEEHPEVDRELDRSWLSRARPGQLLEGRLVGPLCRRGRLPAIFLAVTAREEVRAQRLARRDGTDPASARVEMRRREASERDRYRRFYGIDLDAETPDFSVDSSETAPEAVADALAAFVERRTHRAASAE
jgi:cytidylate kinase